MTKGEKIKSAREAANLTQEELGRACGTTKQTIYKYENDIVSNIPLDRLEAIAKAVGVSSAYIMGWNETTDNLLLKTAREKVNGDRFFEKTLNEQDFLLSVSEEEMQLLVCYRSASIDDRALVELALRKYRESPAQSGRTAG